MLQCVAECERLKGPVGHMSQETGEMCTAVCCSALQCVAVKRCVHEERDLRQMRQMSEERPTTQMSKETWQKCAMCLSFDMGLSLDMCAEMYASLKRLKGPVRQMSKERPTAQM